MTVYTESEECPSEFTGCEAGPSTADPLFTRFSDLPLEIRRVIWEYAAPDPRTVDGSVTVITNFELARPRAIIPPRRAFGNMFARLNHNGTGSGHTISIISMMQDWSGIFGLLHASHESRHVTMETFRLDCTSSLTEDNEPWWDEDDVLYFPRCIPTNMAFDERMLRWMSKIREGPFPHFASIKHIALDFTFEVAKSLASESGRGSAHLATFANTTLLDYRWLQNFPSLLSLKLLFDPVLLGRLEEGTIELYEPLNVVVEQFNRTPSELQTMISGRLEQMAELFGEAQNVPKVECLVMCWRKPRGSRMKWEEHLERLRFGDRRSDPIDLRVASEYE